jgi:TPP-dependent pyruvate/acetoin dehydrogenase alpha subunit
MPIRLFQNRLIREKLLSEEQFEAIEAEAKTEAAAAAHFAEESPELPREQLERKFLLRKMQDQDQRQGYSAKVKSWLEKPEQADLVKSIRASAPI